LSWHFPSEHIKCREQPCTGLFCQICGFHGHTAAKCLKRLKQIPGLNFQGYYQETKPNSPPVRYESAAGNGGAGASHASPPYIHRPLARANASRPQTPAPLPIRPDQHPPALQRQQQQQTTFPHFVNNIQPVNTAPRTQLSRPHPDREERMSKANQTNGGGGGGSAHDVEPSSQRDGQ
jgi:hypothetical protein